MKDGSTTDLFYLPPAAVDYFRRALGAGAAAEDEWKARFAAYQKAFPTEAAEFERIISGRLPEGWQADLPKWTPTDKPIATRAAGGAALNALAKHLPNIVGGSADLNPSTDTAMKGFGDFQPAESEGPGTLGAVGGEWGYAGRNVAFGVREHAMGAAVNGMAAHGGVLPFSATFFTFSDYMKPAIRLGAMSRLKAVYVFTHDSVGVGDGTQPVSHEPIWSSSPACGRFLKLTVIRPADPNETAEAWTFAVEHDGPTLLVLTRQAVAHLDRSNARSPGVSRGAYILSEAEGGSPDVILIGTGSEVQLCAKAQGKLKSYMELKHAGSQHAELGSLRCTGSVG